MNISEFARGRGLDPQAVSRYIGRHKADFEGLVSREGKSLVLSDEALDILDKVYPLPRPVEVVMDHESRDKLLAAQETIIQLQRQLADQTALLAEAKYQALLLEQRDQELEHQSEELAAKAAELSERDSQLLAKDAELQRLQEELSKASEEAEAERERREQMEQAGIFARLFKTW